MAADRPAATIAAWVRQEPALQGCCTPADLLAAVRPQPDAVLGALIRVIQTQASASGEDGGLADRIVLRAMLPKMLRMARRDPDADLDDYLTELWLRVRSYPLPRRPTHIAANLALDTLKSVKAESSRASRADAAGVAALPDWAILRSAPDAVSPTAVSVLREASELGLIDLLTRRILDEVYTEGRSGREVAERLCISPAAVRFRCSRAARRLAGRAGELVAA